MAKERKSAYRAQFDGHRRLAAAVILQAIKDVSSGGPSPQEKETAVDFLQGDMWPFSDVLDLPADGAALQVYLKNADLGSIEADPATN
jgi:hypothetical protein